MLPYIYINKNAQAMTTFQNYYQATNALFTSMTEKQMDEVLDQYYKSRRSRKINTITFDGKIWNIDFESQKKSSYFRSRSFSYYFTCEETGELMRISDHWSRSNIDRSNKLNCGMIASCYWEVYGETTESRVPSEKYPSRFMGGIVKLSDMHREEYATA